MRSLPSAVKPFHWQLRCSSGTDEDKHPKHSSCVPNCLSPSYPKHLFLQSPGPACSLAGDKHVLVPASNKSLASQSISCFVTLPQVISPSSFAAAHGAEDFLPPHSHAQRRFDHLGNVWILFLSRTFYLWPFSLGSVFATGLIWSPREFASKGWSKPWQQPPLCFVYCNTGYCICRLSTNQVLFP